MALGSGRHADRQWRLVIGTTMKAIAVLPGKPGSVHLAELRALSQRRAERARRARQGSRVGVDGTDREINAAEYGAAPQGYDFLVIGHEGFGRVGEVGPNVTFAEARRLRSSHGAASRGVIYDVIGTHDMTTDDTYFERGINLRHGYLTEYYVEMPSSSSRCRAD